MHLNPAEYVIHKFGGIRSLARVIGRSPASVCKWQSGDFESRGLIPSRAQRIILEKAKRLQVDVTPKDLIEGRSVRMGEILRKQCN